MSLDSDLLSIQEVRTKVDLAYAAWQKYRRFTQEQVDAIVEAMAAYGRGELGENTIPLHSVDRLIVIGSDGMMRAVQQARHGIGPTGSGT